MAANKDKNVQPKKRDPNVLQITANPEEGAEIAIARAAISPSVTNVIGMRPFITKQHGELDVMSLIDALKESISDVQAGDMKGAEAMLTSQAHTLNIIFIEMARRAAMNMTEYLNATDTYMRLALKAQSQCRSTLETLSAIKNPPVIFAKQANIAHGHQQVNNCTAVPARGETNTPQNELLTDDNHGTTLDDGRTNAAIRTDQELETVGAIDGRKDA